MPCQWHGRLRQRWMGERAERQQTREATVTGHGMRKNGLVDEKGALQWRRRPKTNGPCLPVSWMRSALRWDQDRCRPKVTRGGRGQKARTQCACHLWGCVYGHTDPQVSRKKYGDGTQRASAERELHVQMVQQAACPARCWSAGGCERGREGLVGAGEPRRRRPSCSSSMILGYGPGADGTAAEDGAPGRQRKNERVGCA